MPGGLDGCRLAEEAQRRRPGIAVLFTSGYARNDITHQRNDPGATLAGAPHPGVPLIVKPFTFAALAAEIRQALEGA